MKIEIIAGSPREKSTTRRVAYFLRKQLEQHDDVEVNIIDMKDWNLPPVQQVFSSPEAAPVDLLPLARRVFEADAFILLTPEYNGSYSPAMKNLLDHFPKQRHKAFGIATASPGAYGGMRATQQLLLLIPALFGVASPYLLVIPAVEKKFDPDGNITDLSFENTAHNFVTEFLWLARRMVKEPSLT